MHNHTIWFSIYLLAYSTKIMCRTLVFWFTFVCIFYNIKQTNPSQQEHLCGLRFALLERPFSLMLHNNSAYSSSFHACHWITPPLSTGSHRSIFFLTFCKWCYTGTQTSGATWTQPSTWTSTKTRTHGQLGQARKQEHNYNEYILLLLHQVLP